MNIQKLVLTAAATIMTTGMPLAAQAQNTDSVDQAVEQVSLFPARMIGLTAGVGLGVPLATVRATVEKTVHFRDKISNALPDTGSPANKAYATLLAVPSGLLAGVIDGPYYGCKNALENGYDHPFSAQSISMGDDDISQ